MVKYIGIVTALCNLNSTHNGQIKYDVLYNIKRRFYTLRNIQMYATFLLSKVNIIVDRMALFKIPNLMKVEKAK